VPVEEQRTRPCPAWPGGTQLARTAGPHTGGSAGHTPPGSGTHLAPRARGIRRRLRPAQPPHRPAARESPEDRPRPESALLLAIAHADRRATLPPPVSATAHRPTGPGSRAHPAAAPGATTPTAAGPGLPERRRSGLSRR